MKERKEDWWNRSFPEITLRARNEHVKDRSLVSGDLVRAIEPQKIVNTCQRSLCYDASVHASFLSNDVEKLLETALKGEDFLDVWTLRYKGLNHADCL